MSPVSTRSINVWCLDIDFSPSDRTPNKNSIGAHDAYMTTANVVDFNLAAVMVAPVPVAPLAVSATGVRLELGALRAPFSTRHVDLATRWNNLLLPGIRVNDHSL